MTEPVYANKANKIDLVGMIGATSVVIVGFA